MIERIVFAGDVFRPADWANIGIKRLSQCLLPVICAAAGRPGLTVFTGDNAPVRQSELYAALDRAPTTETWISLYTGTLSLNEAVGHILRPLFSNSLVFGYELPAALLRWLASESIPVIDVALCPLQFMEDIALSMRSDDPMIAAQLLKYHLEEPTIQAMAGIAKSSLVTEPTPPEADLEDVVLFCTSTPNDRMLTLGNRHATFRDFESEVASLCTSHKTALVKGHPWGGITEEDAALFAQFPNVRRTTANIYTLMSLVPGLKKVVSLVSSASLEAPYFGVPGLNLLRPPVEIALGNDDDYTVGRYATILHDFWNVSFWADVLEPVCGRAARLPRDMAVMPHRLRNVLDLHGPVTPVFHGPVKRGQALHSVGAVVTERLGKLVVGDAGWIAPLSVGADFGMLADWHSGDAPPDQSLTRLFVDSNGLFRFQTLDDHYGFGQDVFGWSRIGPELDSIIAFGDFQPSESGIYNNGSRTSFWHNTFTHVVTLCAFTVATLPEGVMGETAYCSDGRVRDQGPGEGTGTQVTHNGTAWCVTGTDRPVVA